MISLMRPPFAAVQVIPGTQAANAVEAVGAMGFAVWGAAAALLVLLGLALHVRRRRAVAAEIGDPALLARITGEDLRSVPWRRVGAVGAAAVALALALADPRWGGPEAATARTGTVVLVLDASSSMLAMDITPSRLERERQAARAIAIALPHSPVGVIAFAGRAYAVAPPTLDAGSIELYLEALHPDMVTQTGSSLAAAVRQGLGMLVADEASRGGALVVISDGDTDEGPDALLAAADLARRAGIPVHVLGAGTARGASVPAIDSESGRVGGVLRDEAGEPIVTRLDEARLRGLAERTGGTYLPLTDPDGPTRIAARVAAHPPRGDAAVADPGARPPPRFAWFALVALALLAWDAAPLRRGRGATGAAAIALGALPLLLTACNDADPAQAFRAGRYDEARRGYLQTLSRDPGSPAAHYGVGAAAIRLGEHAAARPHLEIAARTGDTRLRQWAFYNLGNSRLEPVVADRSTDREADLVQAVVAYKRALLLDPHDPDAKWNLEIARRLLEREMRSPRPRPDPRTGGGGDGGGGGDSDPGTADPRQRSAVSGGVAPSLSRSEAERVLQAAETRELGLQREKLRRPQPRVVSH